MDSNQHNAPVVTWGKIMSILPVMKDRYRTLAVIYKSLLNDSRFTPYRVFVFRYWGLGFMSHLEVKNCALFLLYDCTAPCDWQCQMKGTPKHYPAKVINCIALFALYL